jgi:F-box/leucine-rich repeat protein 7
LFQKASISFLHELALKIVLVRSSPGDIIFKQGDTAKSMFIIVDGTVEVLSLNEKVVFAEMSPDSYFGEVSLFFDLHLRTATVRSKTESTLIELGKEAFDATILTYPELKQSIELVATENYQRFLDREKTSKSLKVQSSFLSFEATAESFKAVL